MEPRQCPAYKKSSPDPSGELLELLQQINLQLAAQARRLFHSVKTLRRKLPSYD
jgi:hypothetical protein